jgi:hypothetical protein
MAREFALRHVFANVTQTLVNGVSHAMHECRACLGAHFFGTMFELIGQPTSSRGPDTLTAALQFVCQRAQQGGIALCVRALDADQNFVRAACERPAQLGYKCAIPAADRLKVWQIKYGRCARRLTGRGGRRGPGGAVAGGIRRRAGHAKALQNLPQSGLFQWFGQKPLHSRHETALEFARHDARGQCRDRGARASARAQADLARRGKSIHDGHLYVHQDEIEHTSRPRMLSSSAYRARQTVCLADLPHAQCVAQLDEGPTGLHASTMQRSGWLRAKTLQPPSPGTNTLLVTHMPNLIDAFDERARKIAVGEALIFRPDGQGGTELIGHLRVADWPG